MPDKLCFIYSTVFYSKTQRANFANIKSNYDMDTTRSGEQVSAQIGKMGVVVLTDSGFSLPDGDSVTTQFDCGWNPEIVKKIMPTSLANTNLKWGF